jgi:hypothetical protein
MSPLFLFQVHSHKFSPAVVKFSLRFATDAYNMQEWHIPLISKQEDSIKYRKELVASREDCRFWCLIFWE